MNKSSVFRYSFGKIITEQYAVFEKVYDPKDEITIMSNFNFNFGNNQPVVKVDAGFVLSHETNIFLKLSISCLFNIHPEDWKNVLREDEFKYVLEAAKAVHLAGLVVGIARGILHVKTEQTLFAGLVLPGMDLHEHLKEDIEIKIQNSEMQESE